MSLKFWTAWWGKKQEEDLLMLPANFKPGIQRFIEEAIPDPGTTRKPKETDKELRNRILHEPLDPEPTRSFGNPEVRIVNVPDNQKEALLERVRQKTREKWGGKGKDKRWLGVVVPGQYTLDEYRQAHGYPPVHPEYCMCEPCLQKDGDDRWEG